MIGKTPPFCDRRVREQASTDLVADYSKSSATS
jgi:hypothetical protein